MSTIDELVTRYRDEPSPTLPAEWPLLRLLDNRSSDQLLADLRRAGQPWEVQGATEHAWETTPDQPGLYMFVWRAHFTFDVADNRRSGDLAQVLYVGKAGASDAGQPTSGTLKSRYRDYVKHLRGDPDELWSPLEARTRPKLLSRYLTLRPLEHWFSVIPQHHEIPLLEDRLIKLIGPPCNRQRMPKLRPGPAGPAF